MAKVQRKSEKITSFGGIFQIMKLFNILLGETINSTLGLRCASCGYQRPLQLVYLASSSV